MPTEQTLETTEDVVTEPSENTSVTDSVMNCSIDELVGGIDDISKTLAAQQQIFKAEDQLATLCYGLDISQEDQKLIGEKFKAKAYTEKDIANICKKEETINKVFFTREDESVIKVKTVPGETQYTTKKELVMYLNQFYDMERSIEQSIQGMRNDIKEFKTEEVSSLSMTIVNNLKAALDKREEEALALENPEEKARRLKMITRLRSAYTFDELIDVIDKYPSTVKNAMSEFKKPQKIKETGARYKSKLDQVNTFLTVYDCISDDLSKTVESQFLHEDDYVKGCENFFGFLLVRFFAMGTWTGKDVFMKEMHTATSMILTNLMQGKLDQEFRDEVVENIKSVWAKVKEII